MRTAVPQLLPLSWLLALALPLSASATDRLRFELTGGSTILDECGPCDRAPIERVLSGSFVLLTKDLTSPAASYLLEGIDFRDPSGDYRITGSGSYLRSGGKQQELALDLEISGAKGVALRSGTAEITDPWPALRIIVREGGERDPFHIYTLTLAAEPPAKEPVRYELEKGSIFIDDCLVCGRPTVPIPITGTFLLGKVEDRPDFTTTYRVSGIEFQDAAGTSSLKITGGGCYAQGGDFALMQDMSLEVSVNGTGGVLLASPSSPPAAAFPDLDVELLHQNPESTFHVFSLHILASPLEAKQLPFRRGDANDDGRVDISDPVGILFWRFSGAAEPGCLESADANGDGQHDLSDAVFLLEYLFLDGTAPPSPGPAACDQGGPAADCASYHSCATTT